MASLLSTSQPTYSYDVDGITRAEPKQRTWVVLSGVAVMAVVGALLVLGSTQSAVSYKVLTTTAPTVAAPRTATRGQALSGVRAVPVVGQNARLNAQQTAAARSQGASAVNTDALDAGVEAQEVPEAVYVADTQTNYSAAAPLGFLAGVLATAAFFVTRGSKQQELPRYAMMATGKSSQKGKQTGKGAAAPAATDASERGGRAWALQQPGISAPFPGMFDPLNLAANASEKDVRRWREAELTHGRVAMLAALGFVVGEQLEDFPAFLNFDGGISGIPAINQFQRVEEVRPLFWESLVLAIGLAEGYRVSAGWANPKGGTGFNQLADDYTPGELGFDPLNLFPSDPDEIFALKTKELNNGRLAMIGIAGFVAQELVVEREIFEHLALTLEKDVGLAQ